MFYKVKEVKALGEYNLLITFENGEKKYYNVKSLFEKWTMFSELKDNDELFSSVKVDNGGYGISWNENIDISCNELWENGTEEINK